MAQSAGTVILLWKSGRWVIALCPVPTNVSLTALNIKYS